MRRKVPPRQRGDVVDAQLGKLRPVTPRNHIAPRTLSQCGGAGTKAFPSMLLPLFANRMPFRNRPLIALLDPITKSLERFIAMRQRLAVSNLPTAALRGHTLHVAPLTAETKHTT